MSLTNTQPIADNLARLLSEEEMAERIPSNMFIARAVPTESGRFHALYSAPGFIPAIAADSDGRPYEYLTAEEAEIGAMRTLYRILNKPRVNARRHADHGKPERYRKMTNVEFAVALRNANITPSYFAFLYGTSQTRVIGWIDGTDQVPHPARLLLGLFIDNDRNVDIAQQITNAVTEARQKRS